MRAFLIAAVMAFTPAAWADGLPVVQAPQGYIESSTLIPALKAQALLGHSQNTKLIGVYLLPDEVSSILHGAPIHMSTFCRAYVNLQFDSEEQAKTFFLKMVIGMKKESSKVFNPDDPENKLIIQHYIDATKKGEGQSVSLTGTTNLGSLMETKDVFAWSVVVAMSAHTENGLIVIPVNAAVASVRRGKQILELSVTSQFDGQNSITHADRVLTDWISMLPNQLSGP